MQLGHAGRKVATKAPWEGFEPLGDEDASAGQPPWRGYSSSAIPFKPGSLPPIEMDRGDIRHVIHLHVEAVKRTLDAGFDICEIHAAHGYLIQQFFHRSSTSARMHTVATSKGECDSASS